MQWFIDVIYAKCKAYIDAYLAAHPPACCFIDRGDPASADYNQNDLVHDGVWHDLDLSGVVPAGARAVVLRVAIIDSDITLKIHFKTKGNAYWPNVAECHLYIANLTHHYDKVVTLDPNRKIRYRILGGIFNTVLITVAAWFVGSWGVAGFVNRGDPAAPDFLTGDFIKDTTWRSLDLSGIIPAGTKAVLLLCDLRSTIGARRIRFRTHGNLNAYNISHCRVPMSNLNYAYDIKVPTDGHQQIEYNCTAATYPELNLTVKGWCF